MEFNLVKRIQKREVPLCARTNLNFIADQLLLLQQQARKLCLWVFLLLLLLLPLRLMKKEEILKKQIGDRGDLLGRLIEHQQCYEQIG